MNISIEAIELWKIKKRLIFESFFENRKVNELINLATLKRSVNTFFKFSENIKLDDFIE